MRRPVISRGIYYTDFNCLCIDVQTKAVSNKVFRMRGIYHITKRALRLLKEQNDTEDMKIVQIDSVNVITKLYGMTIDEFLAKARPMDENRHFIDEQ